MDCIKDYNELLESCGCETKEELDVGDELNDIAKRLVSVVNKSLRINNDLVAIAVEIAKINDCLVPTNIYENLCCIQKSVNDINCSSSKAAKCLQSLVCNIKEYNQINEREKTKKRSKDC